MLVRLSQITYSDYCCYANRLGSSVSSGWSCDFLSGSFQAEASAEEIFEERPLTRFHQSLVAAEEKVGPSSGRLEKDKKIERFGRNQRSRSNRGKDRRISYQKKTLRLRVFIGALSSFFCGFFTQRESTQRESIQRINLKTVDSERTSFC